MTWRPTTDDEFTTGDLASSTYEAMVDFGAGQSEISGTDDDDRRIFSVVVAIDDVSGAVLAAHIDWKTQTVVTAWREVPDA